jgi:hypothetical protein
MALKIIDNAICTMAGGVSDDGARQAYAGIRTLRLADGPDEVHNRAIARLELGSIKTLRGTKGTPKTRRS